MNADKDRHEFREKWDAYIFADRLGVLIYAIDVKRKALKANHLL